MWLGKVLRPLPLMVRLSLLIFCVSLKRYLYLFINFLNTHGIIHIIHLNPPICISCYLNYLGGNFKSIDFFFYPLGQSSYKLKMIHLLTVEIFPY